LLGDFKVVELNEEWKTRWAPRAKSLRVRQPDKFIQGLPAPASGSVDYRDPTVPGLRLQVYASGRRHFVLLNRYGGKHASRRSLGWFGVLTVEEARTKARAWLQLIGKGLDPSAVAREERAANQAKTGETFGAVAEAYLTSRDFVKLVHRAEAERLVRSELIRRWKDRPIAAVGQHEVVAAIEEAARRGPHRGRAVYGYLKQVYGWARGRGMRITNPTDGLSLAKLVGKATARSRILSATELRQTWRAALSLNYPAAPLVQMLVLTGARLREVAEMVWGEVDFESRVWTIPAERMKGRVAHVVPLCDAALALLGALPRWAKSDCVFSAKGKLAISGFSKMKAALDTAIGEVRAFDGVTEAMAPWVLHDIRRTVRTGFSALPVEDHVRERVIAHVQGGVRGVYDLHSYLDEKRKCLALWELKLTGLLAPARSAEVVSIKAKRAR
jgi:integrase